MRAARSTIHNNLNLLKLRMTSGAVTVVHVQIVQNCEAFLLFNSAAVSVCKIYSTVKHKSNF